MQAEKIRAAIAATGCDLRPQILGECRALFGDEQKALARSTPPSVIDAAYGLHERHRLDLYRRADNAGAVSTPIILFVHGGGFVRGDKGSADDWFNANVGRMAARAGFLGVVMNYRLAPASCWPAGGEDVGAAVDWLKANAGRHGGDPERIVIAGTSAGAVHVATYLQLRPTAAEVRGVVLLSGLYGFTQADERDLAYYEDRRLYSSRVPLDAVTRTTIPLLVACAEFDPPRFQAEFLGLLQARLQRQGKAPRAYIASGHNHYSLAMHLGTADTRFADEILEFTRHVCS